MSDLEYRENSNDPLNDANNPAVAHERNQLDAHVGQNTKPADSDSGGGLFNPEGDGKEHRRFGVARLDQIESLTPGQGRALKFSFRFTKRRGLFGLLVATIIGILFGFSIGSGPAMLIQAAHLLEHESAKQEDDNSSAVGRMTRFYRAFSNKDINYTRVGIIGARRYSSTLQKLKDAGITVENGPLGRPTAYGFDKATICESDPTVCEMSDDEFKQYISEKIDIPEADLTHANGKVIADVSEYKFLDRAALAKTSFKALSDGDIITFLEYRNLTKAWGIDNLFHPFSRAVQEKIDDKVSAAVKAGKSESQAENEALADTSTEGTKDLTGGLEARAQADQDQVEGKKGSLGLKIVGLASAGAATACIVHDTSESIVAINRQTVELPAAAKAVNLMAIGSQLENGGKDVTGDQVRMADDDAQALFKSPAVQALNGTGKTGARSDLPRSYGVAFSDNSTAANIGHYADVALGGHAGTICNKWVQLGAGAVLAIGAAAYEAFTAPETAGTSTALLVGGVSLITSAVSGYVSGEIIGSVQHTIIDNNTVQKIPENFYKTPAGGTLIASGARLASNSVAISSAGISLGNNDSTAVAAAQLQEDKQQFASESMFARMFDINDSRTILGRLAQTLSPGPASDIASGIRNITSFGSTLTSMFGSLIPHVGADGTQASYSSNFKWGFGQYGIPDFIMNDPDFEDPYATAINAGHFFETSAGQSDISRAQACFGQQIAKSSVDGAWDTVPTGADIDPHSDDYIAANCNPFQGNSDANDKNWALTMMFIFYTMNAKTVDCYDGGAQSCQDIGVTSSGDATGALTSTNYKNPIIDQQSAGESVVRDSDGTFQLYATGNGKIQHWTSTDAVHWKGQYSLAVTGAPGGTTTEIWKPSVTKINDTYVFSYAGGSGSGHGFNIYYGTSSSPNGPVKYGGKLASSISADKNAIDPQIFADDDGSYYLYYTNGRTYGLRGVKLNVNGTSITPSGTPKLLVSFDASHGDDWTIEAPYVIKRSGYYYMTFSTGNYTERSNYMVHVARSTSPLGPFERKQGNDIIIQSNAAWVGPGTTTMFTDDANQDWMIYAARYPSGRMDRVSMLDRVTYDADGWPIVNNGDGPSNTVMPGPAIRTAGGGSNPGGQASIADTYGPACTGRGGSTFGVACTGQCVDYVEYLLNKTYNAPGKYGGFGTGANTVPKLISTYGFKRDTTAQVGDVVSYPVNMTSSGAGHTAAVIKVNTDGSIVVAEYNWSNNGPISLHDQYGYHSFDTRTVTAAIASQLSYAHTNLNFN